MENQIPQLRFPEFTGDWARKTFGELSERIGDGLHGTPIYDEHSDIYFINGNNLVNGKIQITVNTKRVSPETFKKNNKNLSKNTLLISLNGTIGNISKHNNEKVMLSKSVGYFNFLDESNLYYYILNTETVQNLFISELTGSTIKNLSLKTLREAKISFPATLPEQTKIATFLTAVDEKLTALKQKKTLLAQYKKGAMQKIFSQELRFKDENGNEFADWEEKKLGEICRFFSGGTPLTSKRQYFGGNIPFIRSGEINSNHTEQFITEEGLKNSSAKMVDVGDILYALYGATSGEVGISKIKGAINQAVLCIRSTENHFYIFSFLKYEKENIITTFLQGGQGNLSADIVKKVSIPIPSISEQTKIANFLSAIDDKINLCNNEIAQIQTWKKGLLQQLFV